MTGFFAGPAGAGVGPAAVGYVAVSIPPFKGTPVGDTTPPPPTVVTTGVVLVVLLVVAK